MQKQLACLLLRARCEESCTYSGTAILWETLMSKMSHKIDHGTPCVDTSWMPLRIVKTFILLPDPCV